MNAQWRVYANCLMKHLLIETEYNVSDENINYKQSQ